MDATKNPPVDGGLIHSLQIITKPLARAQASSRGLNIDGFPYRTLD
ncbi:MAG TPA: hypothetical protein VNV35_04395 [Puia sp.]|jgi:hypothetical protein|nr:hypothetical protein [Puia sp.]